MTGRFGALAHGGNVTGIAAMLAAMAFFVANDTCVKLVGATLPLGELITLRNAMCDQLYSSFSQDCSAA